MGRRDRTGVLLSAYGGESLSPVKPSQARSSHAWVELALLDSLDDHSGLSTCKRTSDERNGQTKLYKPFVKRMVQAVWPQGRRSVSPCELQSPADPRSTPGTGDRGEWGPARPGRHSLQPRRFSATCSETDMPLADRRAQVSRTSNT